VGIKMVHTHTKKQNQKHCSGLSFPIKKNLKLLTNIYIYFIPIKLSEECSVKGEWGLVNGRFIGAGKYV